MNTVVAFDPDTMNLSKCRVDDAMANLSVILTLKSKDKEQQKITLKYWFFSIVMLVFIIAVISPMIVIYLFRDQVSGNMFVVPLVSALIELIIAIIMLPKIIAKYLFNRNEDKEILEVLRELNNHFK